jgi:hypothetical protein
MLNEWLPPAVVIFSKSPNTCLIRCLLAGWSRDMTGAVARNWASAAPNSSQCRCGTSWMRTLGTVKEPPPEITLAEMRAAGVRGLLIYCSDYICSH